VRDKERLHRRHERECIGAGQEVADDAQAVDEGRAVVIEATDEIAIAAARIGASEPRDLHEAGVQEGRFEMRIRSTIAPVLEEMAPVVASYLEIVLEVWSGPLAARGDAREAVQPWNPCEHATDCLAEALAEGSVTHRDHALGVLPFEAVITQHLQVVFRRPRILILGRQRVAGEEEHLLRRVEEPRAAGLAGRLLELLEAQRTAGAAKEASTELGGEHDDVAAQVRGTDECLLHPRAVARCRDERVEIDELELLGRELCPEDVDLLGTVQRERAHAKACPGGRCECEEQQRGEQSCHGGFVAMFASGKACGGPTAARAPVHAPAPGLGGMSTRGAGRAARAL
jgi:hypothetical protein